MPLFNIKGYGKKLPLLLLALKLVSGLFSWGIYQFYYGGNNVDIINYWKDSELIYLVAKLNFTHFIEIFLWNSKSEIPDHLWPYLKDTHYCMNMSDFSIIRIQTLIRFISGGNIMTHVLIFAFISYTGLCFIYKSFEENIVYSKTLIYSVFLIPSVLFWSSGMHKESLALFGFGLSLYFFRKNDLSLKNILYIIVGILILYFIRKLMLLWLLGYFLFWGVEAFCKDKKKLYKLIISSVFIVFFFVIFHFNDVSKQLKEKRIDFIENTFGRYELDKLSIHDHNSFIAYFQESVYHAFCFPAVWEPMLSIKYVFAIENIVLILLMIFLIYRINRKKVFMNIDVKYLFISGLFIFILIGFVVNNEIAIMRYKAQFYPVILAALLFSVKRKPAISDNSDQVF